MNEQRRGGGMTRADGTYVRTDQHGNWPEGTVEARKIETTDDLVAMYRRPRTYSQNQAFPPGGIKVN